jgi:hypothetical protein
VGLAYQKNVYENFQQHDVGAALHMAVDRCQRQLTLVRVELAELKRTGSTQHLTSDPVDLLSEIERLENLLKRGQKASV